MCKTCRHDCLLEIEFGMLITARITLSRSSQCIINIFMEAIIIKEVTFVKNVFVGKIWYTVPYEDI